MQIGPFIISRKKSQQDLITQWPTPGSSGWWPVIRESFAGAWQRGARVSVDDACTHPTFWACLTLIAGDIAKMGVNLIEERQNGICVETTNTAYSPVLRRPNHYQNRIQFFSYWILSKLTRGNAYALKQRDKRGVVTSLYLLNPATVRPLVTPSGDVYYALQQDVLSGVDETGVVVPAREIIHDLMFALYHPLVGLSPVYACGHAAMQGLKIVHNSSRLFENGSQPGGVLTAPGTISNDAADRIRKRWDAEFGGEANIGKVAVLGDGLKFEPMSMTAVDSQLIDQLKWGDEKVCSTFHVPPYMVGVGAAPTYNNIEALNQQYYSQCLQVLIESLELCLTEGLELKSGFEVEFDIDDLLRMDSAAQMKFVVDGTRGGVFMPNEGRKRFNLPPVKGGDTIYLQEQDHSLEWLSKRDAIPPPDPNKPAPVPSLPPAPEPKPEPTKAIDEPDVTDDVLARVRKELGLAA